ncbi:ATP-grasp domain-containing protein [Streptomyces sp. NPDC003023]|uniref:ATP-grasp domain-containing protein n=1 Tax=Streptomyces sp. NPDC003023 TaxID=3364675 RepID=UPI0036D082C8
MAQRRPVIAVVYDRGSASPLHIVEGLEVLGEVVLVLCPSAHTDEAAPLAGELARVVRLDPADLDASAARLAELSPDAILTFSESRLPETAELAVRLGLPYHSPGTVELLRDKYAQRTRLRERGTEGVRSFLLRQAGDWPAALAAVGLPAVLKPARGEGSRSTHLVTEASLGAELAARLLPESAAEGERGAAGESALVLEEYLRGRDCGRFGDHVSVESAVSGGRVSHWAVTGKFPLAPPFRETGHMWPAPLEDAELEQVCRLVGGALRALEVTRGVTHTEVKLTPDGPRIIEVNGRLGGFQVQLARLRGGFDAVTLAGRVALGEDVSRLRAPAGPVVFTRSMPSPAGGGTYLGMSGLRAALAVDGVVSVQARHAPGTVLPAGVNTGELAWVEGRVADHDAMFEAADRALGALSFTVAGPGGVPETVSAAHGALPVPGR